MEQKPWYVYVIETEKGLLYTGITNNMIRRFNEHLRTQKGRKGAKFFNFSVPKKLVYIEEVKNRSEATKKEVLIKKMTKLKKLELIRVFSSRSLEIREKIGFNSISK